MIHYRNLQQCLELGMKLKKIHRILKFKQKYWMKPYIDFNTERRKGAVNKANESHFKLWNNAVFGKTMKNMRKKKERVAKNAKDFAKYTSTPTCVNWKVFENNLAAIHEKKIITLNKPIYVGFKVLELSKWEMYKFHYNFMNKKFKRCTLLFIDNDSFCYEYDEDSREKKYKHKELFNLSNLPVSSKYYINDNKKVLCKTEDEYGGKSILKLLGLECLKVTMPLYSFKNFMIHYLRKR